MKLTAWRIVRARLAGNAFDGEGARRFGGRWNSKGTPMVYTAGSQALAVLEMLVHLDSPDLLKHYRLIPVTFDRSLTETLDVQNLPRDWRRHPAPRSVRTLGDQWVNALNTPVLEVPSVIVPAERNYLLNVRHPRFGEIVIGKPQPYRFDVRLR